MLDRLQLLWRVNEQVYLAVGLDGQHQLHKQSLVTVEESLVGVLDQQQIKIAARRRLAARKRPEDNSFLHAVFDQRRQYLLADAVEGVFCAHASCPMGV